MGTLAHTAAEDVTQRPVLPVRALRWLVVTLLLALFVGAVVPPLVINFLKPLPVNETFTTATAPTPATVMHLGGSWPAGERNLPQDPECAQYRDTRDEAPLRCTIATAPASLEQTHTTSKGAERDELILEAHTEIIFDGEPLVLFDEHVTLDRGSALPVPGTPHTYRAYSAALSEEATAEGEARPGLRHFVPFNTERRSYLFSDPATGRDEPIDYIDPTAVGDLDAYVFAQDLNPVRIDATAPNAPIADLLLGNLDFNGRAERFYSDEELAALGLSADDDVELHTYLTSGREIVVEPDTGHVLDVDSYYYAFLARDAEEAENLAREHTDPNPSRTVFHLSGSWTEEMREARYDATAREVTQLRILQILAWIGRFFAVVATAAIAWLILRHRRALQSLPANER
ncbi:porin PorA family protein [Corynebacterium yudongzhengii]|nr:porin PorA family protein [Corynebacterium yudongzhengii]